MTLLPAFPLQQGTTGQPGYSACCDEQLHDLLIQTETFEKWQLFKGLEPSASMPVSAPQVHQVHEDDAQIPIRAV
ncbi:MAG: hypothetical protein DRH37_04390 [Deltaproteobacteria bacterium]|nr:MAG: hypothetical protein DRH37_04390 [Deltaproteobacteria bacterium]